MYLNYRKAIMQKNYTKGYALISSSVYNRKDMAALPIIVLLYNFFSKLLVLHHTQELNPVKIAKEIGINAYFVQAYVNAKQYYTLSQTVQNIMYLHLADTQLKGIDCNITDYQIMKELIFKIMHP